MKLKKDIFKIHKPFKNKNILKIMNEKFIEALNDFKNKKILIIGDIILDEFIWGDIERVNPEQPTAPLVKVTNRTYRLGGAANVANNVVSLGADCCLYGITSEDIYGKKLKQMCLEKKIELKNFYNKNPTLIKQRIMAHGQQVTRIDFGEDKFHKINKEIQNQIINSLKQEIDNYDFIILSDYNKMLFDERLCCNLINLANSKKINTLVDSKPVNLRYFKDCTIISPNKHEAELMTGIKYANGKDVLIKMSMALSEIVNSKYSIITCGEDGAFVYDRENEKHKLIPTKAKDVKDVTGAGDTFAATLTLGLASGLDIEQSADLANYAAGVVVGKVGTATVNVNEIKEYMKK